VDLVVLNLFAEYWAKVSIDGFSTSLVVAVLLQLLLQATLAVEHRVAVWFDGRKGTLWKSARIFSAWFILFGSKFIMLGVLDRVLGTKVEFIGALHGVVAFIVVIAGMLIAEVALVKVFRALR